MGNLKAGEPMQQKQKGILLIILSAFCFALMSMFVRLAGDLPSVQKSFFRNIVAFVFAGIILLREKQAKPALSKPAWGYLLLRAGFGTLGILCNFYAVDNLVLADASILNKMSPFFAILCSYFVLKEKITPARMCIVLGAFVGSLFVIKPSFQNASLFPAVIGLLGGFGAGVAYTMVRKLGTLGVKGPFIVFFFSGFSCLVTLPYLIFNYHPMTGVQLLYLLLAGFAATGGQFTITAAYIYAPAREISVYDYSQILFSSALGFFVFGQTPDVWSFVGYVLIVAMAITMFFYNQKQHSRVGNSRTVPKQQLK